MRRFFKLATAMFASALLAGCAASANWVTVPEALVESAQLAGFDSRIRFWGDESPPNIEKMVGEQIRQSSAHLGGGRGRPGAPVDMSMLSISGGGQNGAFGAGLLNGWSRTGKRPVFLYVTGVSTGALTAPFAFLGSSYDAQLKEVFTTTSTDEVLRTNLISGLTGGAAISDSGPLFALISRYITPAFVDKVAAEHRKGRRLFIGTTNLEAERPMIWNMGVIANSANPAKVELFRKVLLASASIPSIFPPVPVRVMVKGKAYDEVHVDGGTISQVFLYPSQVDVSQLAKRHKLHERRSMYVIFNGQADPSFEKVPLKTIDIANRALSTLIKSQANGDVAKLHALARRDDIRFNLAYIPRKFNVPSNEEFDETYMNALFEKGFELARNGYKWRRKPPSL
jgi:hypothetical protein